MQENDTNKKILKLLFLVLLFGLLFYKTVDYFGAIGYRETWTICLDYLHEGTFWTGQPHCEGALVPFYVLFALDPLVGREYVQIATILFSTLVSVFFFLLFFRVAKKEALVSDDSDFFWSLLFFGLFFYINTITNVEAVLNSFFFFIGYYFLFYSESRFKYFFTGLFFFFSLLSKINVIIQIALVLFWYLYEKKIWHFSEGQLKFHLDKSTLFGCSVVFVPIIFGFLLCSILYKYFWIYSWSVFTNQTIALSILETFKQIIFIDAAKTEPVYFVLLLVVGFATYFFWHERKFYALCAGPGLFVSMFLITRAFGITSAIAMRYWSVTLPFVALFLLRMKQSWIIPPLKYLCTATLLLVLFYPGLYYGPFQLKDDLSYLDNFNILDNHTTGWQQKDAFIKEVHYGFAAIPAQSGRILLENDPAVFRRTLVSFGSSLSFDSIDFLTKKYMESHPDVWGFPRYQELLGDNMIYEPESHNLTATEQEVISTITAGTYSLIIYGPPEWAISEKIFSNFPNGTVSGYCSVLVPTNVWLTHDGWHYSYFFFKNQEDCTSLLQSMYSYYTLNYEDICKQDAFTANMITAVLRQNNLPFAKTCSAGGDSLDYYKRGIATKQVEFLFMLLLFSLPFLFGIRTSSSFSSSQKKFFFGVLAVLLLLLLLVFFFLDTTAPYVAPFVQQITG